MYSINSNNLGKPSVQTSKTSSLYLHHNKGFIAPPNLAFSSINPSRGDSQQATSRGVALTTKQTGEGLFAVVVVEVNGIKCRALIDSGAGSSYVSAKLIELLRIKPTDVQTKTIDMLMTSKIARLEVYDLQLQSVNHHFSLSVKATKVNK